MLFPCNARIHLSVQTSFREEHMSPQTNCDKPGMQTSNIYAAAQQKRNELCLDDKRITVRFGSKLGDVDLYGHEAKPTLVEKKSRLEIELHVITCTKGLL